MTEAEEIYYAAFAKRAFYNRLGHLGEDGVAELLRSAGGDHQKVAGLLGNIVRDWVFDPFKGAIRGGAMALDHASGGHWGAAGKSLVGAAGNAALAGMTFIPGMGWVGKGVGTAAKLSMGGKLFRATKASMPVTKSLMPARHAVYRAGNSFNAGAQKLYGKIPIYRGGLKTQVPLIVGSVAAGKAWAGPGSDNQRATLSYGGDGKITNSSSLKTPSYKDVSPSTPKKSPPPTPATPTYKKKI